MYSRRKAALWERGLVEWDQIDLSRSDRSRAHHSNERSELERTRALLCSEDKQAERLIKFFSGVARRPRQASPEGPSRRRPKTPSGVARRPRHVAQRPQRCRPKAPSCRSKAPAASPEGPRHVARRPLASLKGPGGVARRPPSQTPAEERRPKAPGGPSQTSSSSPFASRPFPREAKECRIRFRCFATARPPQPVVQALLDVLLGVEPPKSIEGG